MSKQPFSPGDLVAGYFRDSGGDAQELSVAQQEGVFRAWCAEHRLAVGVVFRDTAQGSSVAGRQGFQDMMYHFRSRQAAERGLVIWSFSRFARDIDDAQFHRADLRRRGYLVHSLNDQVPEGSMGRFFEAAIDWKNEQFLEDLSRDVKRGLHSLVRDYRAVPGTPPKGFKRDPVVIGRRRDGQEHVVNRWAPDPELVPLVRLAFEMRAAGRSLAEISQVTGLYKSINCWSGFFRNRLYIGILDYGGMVIENYCEAVVDLETWEQVQDQHRRQLHPRRVTSRFLLSGLVYCARCGSPLFGAQHPRESGYSWDAYQCTARKRRRDCDLPYIPKLTLERAVLATLRDYVLLPEVLASHQEIARAEQASRQSTAEQERAALAVRLGAVRRKLSNITEAIAEVGMSKALSDKLIALEREEAGLVGQLADVDKAGCSQLRTYSDGELAYMARELQARLDGEHGDVQRFLRGLIERINIDRQNNFIYGELTYFLLTDRLHLARDDTILSVSMSHPPLGAHTYKHSFSATVRSWKRRS